MLSPVDSVVLYSNVRSKEVENYGVDSSLINSAIRNIVEVYKPDPSRWIKTSTQEANYNDPAYRCAYLYKYAPIHTCLVQDMFRRALAESTSALNPNFQSINNCINICSLGGGPGIDIIGIISALHRKYGLLRFSAKIVESMPGWSGTFKNVLGEFRKNNYGLFENLRPYYLQSSYIVADLLKEMNSDVSKAIASANLITMVKFLSAATCLDTEEMIRNIFKKMHQGAVIFIIDNASGGYSELVSRLAEECRMVFIFGPLQYAQYANIMFDVRKYDSWSCSGTQVTVHLLMKSFSSSAEEWNPFLIWTGCPTDVPRPVRPLLYPPHRHPTY